MAEKSEKRKIIILRAAATIVTFAYLMWIFSNSLATAAISSAASGKVREAVQKCADFIAGEGKITVSEHFIRKAAHFSEFSLLGFLAYFTYFSYLFSKNKAVPICAFSAAATTFRELSQRLTLSVHLLKTTYTSQLSGRFQAISHTSFPLSTFTPTMTARVRHSVIRS